MEFQENNNQEEGNLGNDMESNDGRLQGTSMRTKQHSKSMGQQKREKKKLGLGEKTSIQNSPIQHYEPSEYELYVKEKREKTWRN